MFLLHIALTVRYPCNKGWCVTAGNRPETNLHVSVHGGKIQHAVKQMAEEIGKRTVLLSDSECKSRADFPGNLLSWGWGLTGAIGGEKQQGSLSICG